MSLMAAEPTPHPPQEPGYAGLIQTAAQCESQGDYARAHALLQQCERLLLSQSQSERDLVRVRSGLWRLAPLWWSNFQHGDMVLRRCRADDADFFRHCFSDRFFSNQFNRQQPWSGDLTKALHDSGRLPPLQSGLLMWVVESLRHGPVGLASMSSIDARNMRTELSVGFPGETLPTQALKTTLMMLHFALVLMPFNKVYGYIYADNPHALKNGLHLGFTHEGRIREHFHIPGHGFVSVDLLGLTRSQLHGDARLKTLAKRVIGQQW